MGTRGLWGFVVDGEVRATYNHYDSYPDALGRDVGAWAASLVGSERFAEAADAVRGLRMLGSHDPDPSAEEVKRFARFADGSVSTGADWYSLLRKTQGNPELVLEAGVMEDSEGFAYDSLFCEWGYLVNFDTGMLEVYRGFQKDLGRVRGRFAGGGLNRGYGPITLLGQLPFALCASEMFWEQLSAAVYAHEEAEHAEALDFERLAVVVGQIETGVLPE